MKVVYGGMEERMNETEDREKMKNVYKNVN